MAGPLKGIHAATTLFHRWDGIGQEMSSAWFPPYMMLGIEAKQLNLGLNRTREYCFSPSESPLCAFFAKWSFTEKRLHRS